MTGDGINHTVHLRTFHYRVHFEEDGKLRLVYIHGTDQESLRATPQNTASGLDWRSHIVPADHGVLEEHFRLLKEGTPHEVEFRWIGRSGEVTWFRDCAHPDWALDGGRVVGACGDVFDITTMKAKEDALRAALAERDLILNSASDMLVFVNRDFTIRWANPVAAGIAQLPLEEVVGKRCHEVWCRNHERCADCRVERVFEHGEICEHTARVPDGRIWAIHSAPAFGPDGDITGAVQVGSDITALQEAEARLEESNLRLEAALEELCASQKHLVEQERLAAVGQLAAGIAHDFSNVLGPIVLYSEMVLESGSLSARNDERLRTIIQQAQRGGNLTAQILDFSRQSVMTRQVMDLKPFLKEFIKLLQRTLPENTMLEFTAACEECQIYADPARMQQICMNLALNARDAMPEGGTLRFTLAREQYLAEEDLPFDEFGLGEWAVLNVEDTGDGIDPKHIKRIFEPFFTTKPRGIGNGLGLAQVYGLVRQHSGHVRVVSDKGSGTTFSLYFPLQQTTADTSHPASRRQLRQGNGETILLVEDEVAERTALVEAIVMLGYNVRAVENGMQALDVLHQDDEIDLVLTDLIMPVMGGTQLIKKAKEHRPQQQFLLMTGYPLQETAQELASTQQVRCIQKPISLEQLSQEVVRAMTA